MIDVDYMRENQRNKRIVERLKHLIKESTKEYNITKDSVMKKLLAQDITLFQKILDDKK